MDGLGTFLLLSMLVGVYILIGGIIKIFKALFDVVTFKKPK